MVANHTFSPEMATRRVLFVLLLLPLDAFQIRVRSPPRRADRLIIRASTLLEEALPATVTPTVTVVWAVIALSCAMPRGRSVAAERSRQAARGAHSLRRSRALSSRYAA